MRHLGDREGEFITGRSYGCGPVIGHGLGRLRDRRRVYGFDSRALSIYLRMLRTRDYLSASLACLPTARAAAAIKRRE
jgi:hypothetical protein